MTDMYLISGFLGAGKTTLIQKLLTEAFKSKKVALIENDFGDFSVDAALLREGGYQVLALNAGVKSPGREQQIHPAFSART